MIARWLRRRRERREREATADAAYRDAFEICGTIGPWKVASAYGFEDLRLQHLARNLAERSYVDEAVEAARQGALDGFEVYLGGPLYAATYEASWGRGIVRRS